MKLAAETYEKFKANKTLYENKEHPRESSIFISPTFLKMGKTGMGLSVGVSNYSQTEVRLPLSEIVVAKKIKNEIFVMQNPGLDFVFPLDTVRFDHNKRFSAEIDLNKLFELVD